jgi:OOP family OmpA-OmpF porin
MKTKFVLVVFLIMMVFVTSAQAEVKDGSFSFTPFAGFYVFEGNQNLKNSPIVGLRAGYNFTKNIGLEGYFSYLQTEIQDENHWKPWQDIYSYGIEGLYHFMPEGRFVPFIAIGIGGIHYSEGFNYEDDYGDRFESNKFSVDYGAGVKLFLTDNIALRADVRHVIAMNAKGPDHDNIYNDVYNDFLATFGINFAFGGAQKQVVEARVEEPPSPVEVVVDSDNDGIPDKLDKCPDTPAGVNVDKDGCPLDSDKDGVADYLDKCPDTPVGVSVDKDGCPIKEVVVAKPVIIEKGRQTLNVKFDFDKSIIKEGYYKDIDDLVEVMKQYPDLKIVIEGHTDSVGTTAYNQKLSQERAHAVKKYMVEKSGIDAKRIIAEGFGQEQPIDSNATKEGRRKNRRVEAAVDYLIEK